MSSLSVACLPQTAYREIGSVPRIGYDLEETPESITVAVDKGSVVLNPRNMKTGRFYCVELENLPYLYRKLNDREIEVYGLAEQD